MPQGNEAAEARQQRRASAPDGSEAEPSKDRSGTAIRAHRHPALPAPERDDHLARDDVSDCELSARIFRNHARELADVGLDRHDVVIGLRAAASSLASDGWQPEPWDDGD